MIKIFKKTTLSILIFVIFTSSLPVYALSKNETVYTRLNSDGNIKKIIVSEYIKNDDLDKIEDLTDLKDILNVNGDETFVQDDNKIIWNAKGNDIFYQGTTEKNLPISLVISYKLNGKEMNVEDMLGKDGKVDISIKYINKDKHLVNVNGTIQELYTPFIITTTTFISSENNSNIKVKNGKVVNNGVNSLVLGMTTPGLPESLGLTNIKDMDTVTISYDTTNFELNSIYSVATPKFIEKDDLKIFDKLDSIYSKVNMLSDTSNLLVKGSHELLGGLKMLNSNFSEFNLGMQQLNDGSKKILTSYNQLSSGINQLNNGLSNISYLVSSIDELSKGINNLANATNLISENSKEINNTINNTMLTLTKHIATLQQIAEKTTDENTKQELKKEIDELQQELDTQNLLSLQENFNQLNQGINQVNESMNILNGYTNNLSNDLTPMFEGVLRLKDGSDLFEEGLNKFDNSIQTLTKATNDLNDGTNQIEIGFSTLTDGITKFNNEGISQLVNYINFNLKTMESRIDALVDLSSNYNTFTMKDKNTEGSTKFIMVIDSLKQDNKSVNIEEKVINKKESLWDRIINLIK